jgi:hypothetical protein
MLHNNEGAAGSSNSIFPARSDFPLNSGHSLAFDCADKACTTKKLNNIAEMNFMQGVLI